MTVSSETPTFHHISVKPLHPTFGAEISGVDISVPLAGEIWSEIRQAVTKVSTAFLVYPISRWSVLTYKGISGESSSSVAQSLQMRATFHSPSTSESSTTWHHTSQQVERIALSTMNSLTLATSRLMGLFLAPRAREAKQTRYLNILKVGNCAY
jgi:alpha-ketoglutarate-dependent taurine dioxygenase